MLGSFTFIYELIYTLSTRINALLGFNSAWLPSLTLRKILRERDNPVIIDIGCNVGEFSDLILRYNKEAIIFAFDLHTSLGPLLRKKFANSKFYFKSIALSDRRGFEKLVSAKINDRKAHLSNDKKSKKIKVNTLDNSLEQFKLSKIDVLKIDTEGNDYKIMVGSTKTLRVTEIVIFEIMYKLLVNSGEPNIVIDFLRTNGFKYFYRSTKFFGLVPISQIQPWEVTTQNIVASKSKLK